MLTWDYLISFPQPFFQTFVQPKYTHGQWIFAAPSTNFSSYGVALLMQRNLFVPYGILRNVFLQYGNLHAAVVSV